MTYSLEITDEALADIDEVIDWYFNQQTDLHERCYQKILDCLDKIERHPTHYGFFAEEYRQAFVETFPYKILFKISGSSIGILAVFHLSRSDEALTRRLP